MHSRRTRHKGPKAFEIVANKTADYIKELGDKEFKLSVNQQSPKKQIKKAESGIPKPAEMNTGGRNQNNITSTIKADSGNWVEDLTDTII